MKQKETESIEFPLSKTNIIRGSRTLAREKSLQILAAHFQSNVEIDILFKHIFFRDFNIEEENSENQSNETSLDTEEKFLSEYDIINLTSDYTIDWKDKDIDFGTKLINKSIEHYSFIVSNIKSNSDNWDFDRISIIDKTIIIIGAAEMLSFPDIPIKVTINEAVELAKKYSSDKSSTFVNGLLDKLKRNFLESELINPSKIGSK